MFDLPQQKSRVLEQKEPIAESIAIPGMRFGFGKSSSLFLSRTQMRFCRAFSVGLQGVDFSSTPMQSTGTAWISPCIRADIIIASGSSVYAILQVVDLTLRCRLCIANDFANQHPPIASPLEAYVVQHTCMQVGR
jgi:hypothetical protein